MVSQHVGFLLCVLTYNHPRPSYDSSLNSPSTPRAMMMQCQVPRNRHGVSGTLSLSEGLEHVQRTAQGWFQY